MVPNGGALTAFLNGTQVFSMADGGNTGVPGGNHGRGDG
jgi:hypothetical protein